MTQLNAPETITFPAAIALTRSLLDEMAANTLDETAIQDAIASLVKSGKRSKRLLCYLSHR